MMDATERPPQRGVGTKQKQRIKHGVSEKMFLLFFFSFLLLGGLDELQRQVVAEAILLL